MAAVRAAMWVRRSAAVIAEKFTTAVWETMKREGRAPEEEEGGRQDMGKCSSAFWRHYSWERS